VGAADGGYDGITKIINRGPDDKRWNLVIFAEGYQRPTAWPGSPFDLHARALHAGLMLIPPFGAFAAAINVHRVDTWSVDSGAKDPTKCGGTGHNPRTFFDAKFCNYNRREYVTVAHTRVTQLANAICPHWDALLVLVNSTEYGGSEEAHVAVSTLHNNGIYLAAHELGHSFGLADEYGNTGRHSTALEPAIPNITIQTSMATLKWAGFSNPTVPIPTERPGLCTSRPIRHPVPPGTVGAFEGARSKGCDVYRPQSTCMMRDGVHYFCAVCQHHISARLAEHLVG
jgi:hypothetical protein